MGYALVTILLIQYSSAIDVLTFSFPTERSSFESRTVERAEKIESLTTGVSFDGDVKKTADGC